MTTTNTPTPAEISIAIIGSSRENPKSVELFATRTFTVVAVPNPYKTGFAIHVHFAGNSYGVAGFTSRPSKAALKRAIDAAREYAAKHFAY